MDPSHVSKQPFVEPVGNSKEGKGSSGKLTISRIPTSKQGEGGFKQPQLTPPPPGNTGTHWTGPNEYLLSAAARANIVTSRRYPLAANAESFATQLQRYVHHEGNRPPNRLILLHLRLLAYYPPIPDLLPDLILLIPSENPHISRLAHYHIRQSAPITDSEVYRDLIESLEQEVVHQSPARRAAATKTLAKIFIPSDVSRAVDFVSDVFKCIGGARVQDPSSVVERRKIAGLAIPGTDVSDKPPANKSSGSATPKKKKSVPLLRGQVVAGNVEEDENESREQIDDGAGGVLVNSRGNAAFVKSRFGKMLVGHSVFAALRRINRIAADSCRIEAYFFDSGLQSVVPSTVRHCVALLEIRSQRSPGSVSKYVAKRLPHKNPPEHMRIQLEDLGARVYFARMLGYLAEDPDLVQHIPKNEPPRRRTGPGLSSAISSLRAEARGDTVKAKASNLFKFLFNKERVNEVAASVRSRSGAIASSVAPIRAPKTEDSIGVEFVEALVNLLKNPSNRVLIEALRSLSHRKWTTWFEAPIPQSAVYNSPELLDPSAQGDESTWGVDEDDEDDDGDTGDDEDELGAFVDDIATGAAAGGAENTTSSTSGAANDADPDGVDPDLVNDESKEKQALFSRFSQKRKELRLARINNSTPFYLRKVGQGMVPALEVILRRIYAAMLNDEAVRRFSAADATVVLARAKIYGHSAKEHTRLLKAKAARGQLYGGSNSSRELVAAGAGTVSLSSASGGGDGSQDHVFEPLVTPLRAIMDEDPNQYVRGRAAIALLFIIAAGAGQKGNPEAGSTNFDAQYRHTTADENASILVKYFGYFVTQEGSGRGVGFRIVSEVLDYLLHELLDLCPELGAPAIDLVELWAVTHPTVGVCGRLGALWEKVLSLGHGEAVGSSIARAMSVTPHLERVASAGAVFLRRRMLDLAVITVGSFHMAGSAVPEPLSKEIRTEMERFFSLLWHAALLGPSAECRSLSIEALGGAAALAGDPLRVCTYERLVELVRARGLGLKIPAENVLDALDVLYSTRERFSEARHQNGIARDGSDRSRVWLQLVWRLAAEASSACQILLGMPPPTGWQPLGPSGAQDFANAEDAYGDVRDRQSADKLKDSQIARHAAPSNVEALAIEGGDSDYDRSGRLDTRGVGEVRPSHAALAYAPRNFGRVTDSSSRLRSESHYSDDYSDEAYWSESHRDGRRSRDERRARSPARHSRYESGPSDNDDRYSDRADSRRERRYSRDEPHDTRSGNRRNSYDDDLLEVSRHGRTEQGSLLDDVQETLRGARRRATDALSPKEQEARDRSLAKRLQQEEDQKSGRKSIVDDKLLAAASYAPQTAAKLFRGTMKGGSDFAKRAKNIGRRDSAGGS